MVNCVVAVVVEVMVFTNLRWWWWWPVLRVWHSLQISISNFHFLIHTLTLTSPRVCRLEILIMIIHLPDLVLAFLYSIPIIPLSPRPTVTPPFFEPQINQREPSACSYIHVFTYILYARVCTCMYVHTTLYPRRPLYF
jgi:hypothetical protein